MNIKLKQTIIIIGILVVVLLDIRSFWSALSPSFGYSPKSSKEEDLSASFKDIGQAIDFLKKKEPFVFGEQGEATQQTVEPIIKYKMEILNGSGIDGMARNLMESLSTLENSLEITMGNTQIIPLSTIKFKKSVSEELKTAVLKTVTKELPGIKEEIQADEYPFDITLVIGSG